MAIAQMLAVLAAWVAVAQASNSTNVTIVTTGTTTTVTTSTYTQETQVQITGTLTLQVTGSCIAFCNEADVKAAVESTIANVTGISSSFVSVVLTHSCGSRRLSVASRSRRLDGAVTVTYTITLPVGSSLNGATIAGLITGTSLEQWTTILREALSAAGVVGFTVDVTGRSVPVVGIVSAFTTTTETTTMGSGMDSSALIRAALSSAHLWALLAVLAANQLL